MRDDREERETVERELAAYLAAPHGAGEFTGPTEDEQALGVFAGLYRAGFRLGGKRVHILGGDTAAEAIAARLREGGATVTVGDRAPADAVAYIVRTPYAREMPLDAFTGVEGVCDMTVRPLRSRLLLDAEEADLLTTGGLYPLAAALALARGRTVGEPASPNAIEAAVQEYLRAHMNLAVAGLRGDGAEAIAEALARTMRRPLFHVGRGTDPAAYADAAGRVLLLDEDVIGVDAAFRAVVGGSRCVFVAPPLDTLREGVGENARAARYRAVLTAYTAFCDRTFAYEGDPARTAAEIRADFLREPYVKRNV